MINPDRLLKNINTWIADRVKVHGEYYTAFGIFGIIYYIIPYFFWSHVTDVHFQTLILRIIACLLLFYLVIFHQTKIWWASWELKKYSLENINEEPLSTSDIRKFISNQVHTGMLPLYWYITLCYCLPLMSTYNLLESSFDTTWVVTSSLAILTMVLLVDWISFILLSFIGILLGLVIFIIFHGNLNIEYDNINYFLVIYVYLFSLTISVFFLHQKEMMIRQITNSNEELEELNSNLDKLVLKKTADLKKALEYKTDFLNNISHEIRTPLQGILGVSYSLAENWNNLKDHEKEEQIKIISESSDELMSLVSNLLDLSKFEAGKMLFNFKKGNIINTIETSLSQLKPLLHDRSSELVFHVPKNKKKFVANYDHDRLGQVIRNFISNAVKYSDEGNIEIFLSMTNIMGEKLDPSLASYITVKVKDSGIGVPSDELKEIFFPFAQSSRAKNHAGSTGLGLALCAEIINAHKGRIWAYNNKNEAGSTFCFTIPIDNKLTKTQQKNKLSKKTDNEKTIKQLGQLKILFVDDEKFCQISGKVILESMGHKVTIAASGKEAITYLSEESYDLVFLDLMMPDMYGTDVLKNMKEQKDHAQTPVILQSGASDDQEIAKAISLGARGYIIKPYNKLDIENKIKEILN